MPEPEVIGHDVANRACDEVGDDRERFGHLRTMVADACETYGATRRAEGASEAEAAEAMRRFTDGAAPIVDAHIRCRTLSDDDLVRDRGEIVVTAQENAILFPVLRKRELPEREWYRAVIAYRSAEARIVPNLMRGTFGPTRAAAEKRLADILAEQRAVNAQDRSNRRMLEHEFETFLVGLECSITRAIRLFYGQR
ncbi:hypothetical protein CTI14_02420 [Methylobacterium radiotolerans]|nr:hypothetical protein CTI14_02420 [Methylobacterium radiotolerans]